MGESVRLRSVELSDLDEIVMYWNDAELRKLVGSYALGPVSREDEEEWVRGTWKRRKEKRDFVFAIETVSDGKLIGTIGLHFCDWTNRSAVLGIAIYDSKNWGKGYGQESINLLLEYAFRTLNLNRVELQTFDFNLRAQKCFKKVGFKEIGRKRKAYYMDGTYHDIILMDILKEEWLSHNAR